MFDPRPEGSPVNVVIADHDTEWMMQVTQDLSLHPQVKVIGFAQSGQAAIDRAASMAADAVLMEYALPDMTAAEVARRLAEMSPGTAVFAVSVSLTAQLVMTARSMGVVEIFPKDGFVAREAAGRIASHVDSLRREWAAVASRHGAVRPGTGPAGVRVVEQVVARPVTQTTILTHSPKGGVGKSTIAVNLAAAIKASPILSGLRVALLDFDTQFGNLATFCSLPRNQVLAHNFMKWENVPEDMTPAEVDAGMIQAANGVMVIPAPYNPNDAERPPREILDIADRMLRILRRYFGVIIVDGGPKISAAVDAAMHHATHILLVANPEGQSAENLARVVTEMSPSPDFPEKGDMAHLLRKMSLVVNRVQNRRGDLTPLEVARIVGRPVIAEIPEDEAVGAALHSPQKKQAVEMFPDAPFSQAIKKLANDLCGAYPQGIAEEKTQKKRWKILGGR